MRLTTKRDRRYFWREFFSYMIPMILIVGIVDVFIGFMQCPLHPEYSAPCSVNWILAVTYGVFLIITIILAIVTAKMLRKVKKQIENEFTETINNHAKEQENELKESNPKEITEEDKKSEKKNNSKKIVFKTTKKSTTKKTVAKE